MNNAASQSLFTVVLRGGRPSFEVLAASKFEAECLARMAGHGRNIWYTLSEGDIALQNGR